MKFYHAEVMEPIMKKGNVERKGDTYLACHLCRIDDDNEELKGLDFGKPLTYKDILKCIAEKIILEDNITYEGEINITCDLCFATHFFSEN